MMPPFKNQVLYYPYKLLKLNGRKKRRKGRRRAGGREERRETGKKTD